VRVPAAVSLSLLVCLLAFAAPACADPGLLVGVHDDRIKWTERAPTILRPVRALGLDAMRVTIRWQPGRRNLTGRDHTELLRAVAASKRGVRVVLGVFGLATDAPRSRVAREDYCRFVRNALRRYTEITDVVIWKEANSATFWQPQTDAPEAYSALLARCWDVLHRAVPWVNVLTTTAANQDPVAFIQRMAVAYRESGRRRPLFDTVGHNPYPLTSDESPTAGHAVYVGLGDHDRFVAALDDAFAGTAQPRTPLWYLEIGFQPAVARARRLQYGGFENAAGTLTPDDQATQVASALRVAYCQPRVTAFFNFLLVDEPSLEGWQSGLLWANWKRKPAFAAYRAAIDEIRRFAVDCEAVWPPR